MWSEARLREVPDRFGANAASTTLMSAAINDESARNWTLTLISRSSSDPGLATSLLEIGF